jgi:hypothetical protein
MIEWRLNLNLILILNLKFNFAIVMSLFEI